MSSVRVFTARRYASAVYADIVLCLHVSVRLRAYTYRHMTTAYTTLA